jgi:cobyrinic acid a,c-diamide synthase
VSDQGTSARGLVVSGDHGSAGKTTLSIGLARHLRDAGQVVQAFKKGPDFIDPMWLARASGRPARTLDFVLMGEAGILERFTQARAGSTVALVEGNKGLFDGVDLEGTNSTSALARLLGLPVVLVVDCARTTRGIAPLLLGYTHFEPELTIAGVVLNNVAGSRHEGKLRAAVERYTDVPVLGAVPRLRELEIRERHLGLTTDVETDAAEALIAACARAVAEGTDVAHLLGAAAVLSTTAPLAAAASPVARTRAGVEAPVTIAVARDAAYSFYYPESLEALRAAGATLELFSPLSGRLPPCDGVYLGGGFPELHAARLAANGALLAELRAHAAQGGAIYAECGGLMTLGRTLEHAGVEHAMAGVLPLRAVMTDRPQGRGYMTLAVLGGNAWWDLPRGSSFQAHEFHHSRVELEAAATSFAYRVERGAGAGRGLDGLLSGGVLASYAHLHPSAAPWWAGAFVEAARRGRADRAGTTAAGMRLAV